jgi:sugar phosphate permease
MAITSLSMQSASVDLLDQVGALEAQRFADLNRQLQQQDLSPSARSGLSAEDRSLLQDWKALVARWFAWYQCAFLFGAAAGGLLFGRLGDRFGRARAMGLSILTYSAMAGTSYVAQSPVQLWVLWFMAGTGVGGMWPNGVALVAEAWSGLSKSMVAGLMGTSANIGIFLMATVADKIPITPTDWRWVMIVGGSPFVLGLVALLAVPESPRWLAARQVPASGQAGHTSAREILEPPLLGAVLVGILLATVPMIGGWGSANWMVPWAEDAGAASVPPNPHLKANVQQARSLTGIVGSLLGGWIGSAFGRRGAYFLVSLAALCIAQYSFWFLVPTDSDFLWWVAALGFFSGVYFGWLPLFLPELFPTRVRSTGAGVSFNFGRILTAATIFATGALTKLFDGDFARIGRVTSLIFALGMLAACLAPDTQKRNENFVGS